MAHHQFMIVDINFHKAEVKAAAVACASLDSRAPDYTSAMRKTLNPA